MNKRKIIKGYKTLKSSSFNVDTSSDKFKDGIIYTLFSDEFNSIIYNQGNYYSHLVKELPDFIPISLPYEIKTNNGVWKGRFDTGHSPSQLSFYDEKRKLFLCIDFLLPRITPNISVGIENIDQDILLKYFEYLEELQSLGWEELYLNRFNY